MHTHAQVQARLKTNQQRDAVDRIKSLQNYTPVTESVENGQVAGVSQGPIHKTTPATTQTRFYLMAP